MEGENHPQSPRTAHGGKAKLEDLLRRYGLVSGGTFNVEEACLVRIGKNHDKRLIHFQNKVIFKES